MTRRKAKPPKAEPKPRGRPVHVPTEQNRQKIRMWLVGLYGHEQMAFFLGLDADTMRKHYRVELDLGKAEIDALANQTLVKRMLGATEVKKEIGGQTVVVPVNDHKLADSDLLKFYLRTRCGFKEPKTEVAHSGAVGQYDLTKLSDEELDRVEAILQRASISGGVVNPNGEGEEKG